MDGNDGLEEAHEPSRWERWHSAFVDFYTFLPEDDVIGCPECGATTLRLVATGNPISREGTCHIWCDTCLIGIQLFRITVPDQIEMITAAFDPRLASMPNFRVVM